MKFSEPLKRITIKMQQIKLRISSQVPTQQERCVPTGLCLLSPPAEPNDAKWSHVPAATCTSAQATSNPLDMANSMTHSAYEREKRTPHFFRSDPSDFVRQRPEAYLLYPDTFRDLLSSCQSITSVSTKQIIFHKLYVATLFLDANLFSSWILMTTKLWGWRRHHRNISMLLHPCNLLEGLFLISGVVSLLTFDSRTIEKARFTTQLLFWHSQSPDLHSVWRIPEYIPIYRETQSLFHLFLIIKKKKKVWKIKTY